jgi:hypothetical protein
VPVLPGPRRIFRESLGGVTADTLAQ